MSIAVFYAPNVKDSSFLSEEESFHAIRVLRLKIGEVIHLLDGRGSKFETKIRTIEGKKVAYSGLNLMESEPTPAYKIQLYEGFGRSLLQPNFICPHFRIQFIRWIPSRLSFS